MKPVSKKILIIAAAIFAAGVVLTGISILMGGWPGFQISRSGITSVGKTEEPYELTKTKIDKFSKVDITLDYADIDILESEDDDYYVEYLLDGNSGEPSCKTVGDTFQFYQKDTAARFMFIGTIQSGFPSIDPYLRLYVPKDTALKKLTINNESGNFYASSMNVETADITSDYGAFELSDSKFDELSFYMESADLTMKNCTAKQFEFDGSYGEIDLKEFSSDSAVLSLESYDVAIDAVKLGGLDFKNEYGNLELSLPDKLSTYNFDIYVEYGDIKLPNDASMGNYSDHEDGAKTYQTKGDGKQEMKIYSESGDIDIKGN